MRRAGGPRQPPRPSRRTSGSRRAHGRRAARPSQTACGDGGTAHRHTLDQRRGEPGSGGSLQPLRDARRARLERTICEQPVDRARELVVREAVGVEAHAEAGLVDALRVVVLIPEDRQHDHRQAVVQALRRRVVAAVRHDQVDLRKQRRLRQELGAGHRAREAKLVMAWSERHDHAVPRGAEHVDQPLHQRHVTRAERAEAQVDERAVALASSGGGSHGASVARTLVWRLCHVAASGSLRA